MAPGKFAWHLGRHLGNSAMKAVAVPEPRLRGHPGFGRAHLVLDSLERLGREELLAI